LPRRVSIPLAACRLLSAITGDEQAGNWSREHLLKMDSRFRARLLHAFESGAEHRQAATATNDANAPWPR
jgi:hypothetical protein